jgi:preprotein translocase subunit SecG
VEPLLYYFLIVKVPGKAMDRFTQITGFMMIVLMLYVALIISHPVGEAVVKSIAP